MPTLIIMVGLPGTGKSTLVKELTAMDPDAFVYSTDRLIEEWSAGQGWSYDFGFSKYIDKATQQMNEWLDVAVRDGQNIIWDQTNLGAKKRQGILGRFGKNWEKECRCILPPRGDSQIEDWHWRLANRPGKTIPGHIIRNMTESFSIPRLDEGFDRVYYYDMYGNTGEQHELQIS